MSLRAFRSGGGCLAQFAWRPVVSGTPRPKLSCLACFLHEAAPPLLAAVRGHDRTAAGQATVLCHGGPKPTARHVAADQLLMRGPLYPVRAGGPSLTLPAEPVDRQSVPLTSGDLTPS
jgi:hypothetical protein